MGSQNLLNFIQNESGLDESDPPVLNTITSLVNILQEREYVNRSDNYALTNLFAKETSMINTVIGFVLKGAVNALSDSLRVSGRVASLEVAENSYLLKNN